MVFSVNYAVPEDLADSVFVSFHLQDSLSCFARVACGHIAGWFVDGFALGVNIVVTAATKSFVRSGSN